MNVTFFITLLFALQIVYWLVGRYTSGTISGNMEYYLAGKRVTLFPLLMTFLATIVGGGAVLGAAEEAYKYGWVVIFYPIGGGLGLIVLGLGIGRRLAGFNVSTIPQIFEVYYGSKSLRKVASILSILSLFMVLVAQIIASSKFLGSIGFTSVELFILFWAIVILYTVQGGLKAVISTDMVQAAFFTLVFVFSYGFVAMSNTNTLALGRLEDLSTVSSKLCGWLLMPLMFSVIEQDMGQRCFAAASPKTVSRAAFFAGVITIIICMIPIYFGCLARDMALDVPVGESVFMRAAILLTNPWISAFIGCAVLAAIVSTATSLINAISSNISNDFIKEGTLATSKWITCGISIASIFFAFYFSDIVGLLIQSYELSVSCLFVPVVLALFRREPNAKSALLAIVFGAASFVFFRVYVVDFPREVISVILSSVGYTCGQLCFRRNEVSV